MRSFVIQHYERNLDIGLRTTLAVIHKHVPPQFVMCYREKMVCLYVSNNFLKCTSLGTQSKYPIKLSNDGPVSQNDKEPNLSSHQKIETLMKSYIYKLKSFFGRGLFLIPFVYRIK